MERIKQVIKQEEAEKILNQYAAQKNKGSFEIFHVEEANIPYYLLNVEMRIKRAFGLKPKVIEHVYWVNAVDGEMIRTKEEPEKEPIQTGTVIEQRLDRKKCFQIAEDQAFKHATRFYKSFWSPEIIVKEKEHLCIPYWVFSVKFENTEQEKRILINSYSGDVVGHLKKSQEIYQKVV